MKSTITVRRRFLWLIPYSIEVPKPRIYWSTGGLISCWACTNGAGYPGFGKTPRQAWNDWANWSLV